MAPATVRVICGILGLCLMWFGAQVSAQELGVNPARVLIRSTPSGGTILTGATEPAGTSPDTLSLDPGDYILQVALTGYQPLSYRTTLIAGQRLTLDFILLKTPPEPPVPEELGLEYLPQLPTRMEDEADAVMETYKSAAEIFLIFPFAQGLIGKIAFDENTDFPADEMFYTGAILVAGSYIMGKVFSSHRRGEVRDYNSQIEADNMLAKEHNQELDRAIAKEHADAVILWQENSEGRGLVEEGSW